MHEPILTRVGWVLPVLLAVSSSAALGLGYLYFARPTAGDLGTIRVVVTDEGPNSGNTIHVAVSEAPLIQKDSVSPGNAFTGVIHYPVPYLSRPNLKLTSGKRRYAVTEETELGFTWAANQLPDDFREDVKQDSGAIEKLLGLTLAVAAAQGKLKPGLIFEEFTWEAKGLRGPRPTLPPKTFEQRGAFRTAVGLEGVVFFPAPYASPPGVELSGGLPGHLAQVIITECTAKSFKWRNVAKNEGTFGENKGDISWTARGVLVPAEGN